MQPTYAVLSARHYTTLPSATAAAINNQAAYSVDLEATPTTSVRELYTSKRTRANLNPLTHLRHASCANEGDDVLPVAAKPANRCTHRVDVAQIMRWRARYGVHQPSAHLSMASKNFSCSSSLHLSRGLVIL